MSRMYRIKHVSKLGNDIAYSIEYKTFFKTYDIIIYHDESLNTWDGTIIEYGSWRDLTHDEIMDIIKEVLSDVIRYVCL